MIAKFTPLFVMFFLLHISCANAVTINDEGAALLKSKLGESLVELEKSEGFEIDLKGDMTVTQKKGYYAVKYPALSLKVLDHRENVMMNIGETAINAVPTDDPDIWKMSVALPMPLIATNDKSEELFRINIGKQNFGGLFSFKMNNYPKLSMKYEDVKMTMDGGTDHFFIKQVDVKSNLREKSGLYNGPMKAMLSGLSFNYKGKDVFKVDKTKVDATVEGYNHKTYKKAQQNLKQAINSGTQEDFSDNVINLMRATGSNSFKISLENLSIQNPKSTNDKVDLIKSIKFGGNGSFKDDKLSQTIDLSYSGLSIKSDGQDSNLVPESFSTSFIAKNLPLEDLLKLPSDVVSAKTASNEKLVEDIRKSLPEKLKKAGAFFELKDTKFGNDNYKVKMNGIVKADTSSPLGGVGLLDIETVGLNTIMQELNKSPKGAQMAQQLTIFRLISNEDGDKNTARVELNKQGSLAINGKDMSMFLGGGAPPAQ